VLILQACNRMDAEVVPVGSTRGQVSKDPVDAIQLYVPTVSARPFQA
jgi:hypothetical protein